MPVDFDFGERLVVIRLSGQVTNEGILRAASRLATHPDYERGCDELWLFGDASFEVDGEGMRQVIAQDRRMRARFGDGRVALVASSDLHFGMARMYQTLSDSGTFEVGVFRTRSEADAWLAEARERTS